MSVNSSQRFLSLPSRVLANSFFVLIFLMAGLCCYLIENVTRSHLEQRLNFLLVASHQNLDAWIKKQRRQVVNIVNHHLLRDVLTRISSAECSIICNEQGSAVLTDLLAAQLNQFFTNSEDVGALIIRADGFTIAATGSAIHSESAVLTQTINIEAVLQDQKVKVYLPRPLPVAATGYSGSESSGVFFTSPIYSMAGEPIAVLMLILNAAEQFSEVISLKHRVEEVSVGALPGPDIYAFNRQGVLISVPALSDRLVASNLVQGEKLILNVTLRDPGGDVTRGYQPSRRRDAQNLTRLAAAAIRGGRGVELSGYRNYLGISVIGAWFWDSHLEMGIAVELERSDALYPTRIIQWTILLSALTIAAGFLGLNASVRRKEKEAEKVKERFRTEALVLRAELQKSGQQLEDSFAELHEEVQANKRLYDEMRSAVDLHRTIMDVTSEGILIIGDGSRVLDFNHKFARMWNLDTELVDADPAELGSKVFEGMARQLGDQLDELEKVKSWIPNAQGEEVPDFLILRNGRKLKVLSIPLRQHGLEEGRALLFQETSDR